MLIFEHPALSLMVRVNKTKGNTIVKVERSTNPDGMTTLFPLLRDAKKKEKSKMKAVKNFGLLSFGEEAEGDEETTEQVKVV